MSASTDRIVARGTWGRVEYGVRLNGSMPAKTFYESRNDADKAKLLALFQRMADHGSIRNREKFKQVDGPVFEFKSHQLRVSCYRDGSRWILLHGFVKKADRWPSGELERAVQVMQENRQWELQQARRGTP